ncbi:DUF5655 domain-containing protein [Nocardia sp. CDC159]|uniref:DUF5655 domain-containing protein n=1 Tax=Nocardia pulmonis TaxID=2951408 RepID=A0A9X2EDA2_9NOCA|nr:MULTISPECIES: DUF5655 domain-containing protein [Nocardia]MCM6778797.1 DUF5655 domain-containing protein [Nocardia pulmonis]MCM6791686.1 DUF5655 domain-containing protein [Nocardia sp. CDC159]
MTEGARTPEEFFADSPTGAAIADAVVRAIDAIGPARMRITKSQIAFRRRRGFAYLWRPERYVHSDVPAVLSIALPHELTSARFKEIAHPAATTWMHHLELRAPGEVDDEVRAWLAAAYDRAA